MLKCYLLKCACYAGSHSKRDLIIHSRRIIGKKCGSGMRKIQCQVSNKLNTFKLFNSNHWKFTRNNQYVFINLSVCIYSHGILSWMNLTFHVPLRSLSQIGGLIFFHIFLGGKQRTKFVNVCLLIPS